MNRIVAVRLALVQLLVGALLALPSNAQTSELYLTTHGDGTGTVYVVQNGAIQRQWTSDSAAGSLVVLDTVRTAGHYGGPGAEFSLSGTQVGSFPNPATTGMHADDSTTDGNYIYAFAYDLQQLVRLNLDWSSPVVQFTMGPGPWASVAYDTTDGTFWLLGWTNTLVEHRTASGAVLGSFNVDFSQSLGLALDPADDTLWLVRFGQSELEQWSKTGTLLQTLSIPGLSTIACGVEFRVQRDTTPPVMHCPSLVSVLDEKGGTPGQVVSFTVTATDNRDSAPSVVCVPPSGSFFPRGTTIVTCTATDASGNQSVCTFPVRVTPSVRHR